MAISEPCLITALFLQLFHGGMYGQFPSVRRNLNNIIAVLDLSLPSSLAFIANPVTTIIGRNMPFTWGVAPNVETESGEL